MLQTDDVGNEDDLGLTIRIVVELDVQVRDVLDVARHGGLGGAVLPDHGDMISKLPSPGAVVRQLDSLSVACVILILDWIQDRSG